MSLPLIKVSGAGHTGLAQSGSAAVRLKPGFSGYSRKRVTGGKGSVMLLTGPITATGGGLFYFTGKPKTPVFWNLITGSGLLTALSLVTDEVGNAWARYDAGGYTGPLKIGVSYGG